MAKAIAGQRSPQWHKHCASLDQASFKVSVSRITGFFGGYPSRRSGLHNIAQFTTPTSRRGRETSTINFWFRRRPRRVSLFLSYRMHPPWPFYAFILFQTVSHRHFPVILRSTVGARFEKNELECFIVVRGSCGSVASKRPFDVPTGERGSHPYPWRLTNSQFFCREVGASKIGPFSRQKCIHCHRRQGLVPYTIFQLCILAWSTPYGSNEVQQFGLGY